ncbi:hypothetical protein Mapa_017554 [Marchantia paleacea]|nr:hypothetical protein Mapa_017554 [Marchantia paleacea]
MEDTSLSGLCLDAGSMNRLYLLLLNIWPPSTSAPSRIPRALAMAIAIQKVKIICVSNHTHNGFTERISDLFSWHNLFPVSGHCLRPASNRYRERFISKRSAYDTITDITAVKVMNFWNLEGFVGSSWKRRIRDSAISKWEELKSSF